MSIRSLTTVLFGLWVCAGCGEANDAPAEEGPQAAEESTAARADTPAEVGTIRATLGGEDRTWSSLYMERDGEAESTSTFQTRTVGMATLHSLLIAGHVGASVSPDGSLRISISDTDPLDSCPCTFENQQMEYWVDFPNDGYETGSAQVTVDRFEQADDGTYEATGSFSGRLTQTEGDASDALPVEGTFDVRQIVDVSR